MNQEQKEKLGSIQKEMYAASFQHPRLPMINSAYFLVHHEPALLPATAYYHFFGCGAPGEELPPCESCLEKLAFLLGEEEGKLHVYTSNIRTVIYNDGVEERVLIEWPDGSEAPEHDHGKSYGTTYVIRGMVYEMRDGKITFYKAGDKFTEDPETIHKVGSETGALTLHIYRPPITGTNHFYDS
jgi:quercetin dioxygenase-like cupin family protein